MDETNQDSLASYLQMNHQQLRSLLLATGLARLHGLLQKFQILRNHFGWDSFCFDQSLEQGYYFDAMFVNNKRHYWIGIGLESKKKKAVLDDARKVVDTALNPGTQSTFFKTPSRLPKSNQALLQKNSSMMLSLLGVYKEEIEKKKQADADDEQDNLDATTDRINSADDDQDKDSIDKNLCTSALVLLQQIFQDQITDPVQAIEGLLKTIRGVSQPECETEGKTFLGLGS
jgi:hypothetical protein